MEKASFGLLFLLLSSFVVFQSCRERSTELNRKEMPFEKYGFERKEITESSFEFLMGNGEMGGRLHMNGLGFEKLWFADYWKSPTQRQFVAGPLLKNDLLQKAKPTFYHSTLSIDKALATTSLAFGDTSYTSELFFSFEDRHLLGLRVKNTGKKPLNFDLIIPVDSFKLMLGANEIIGNNQESEVYNKLSWKLKSSLPIVQAQQGWVITIPIGESIELMFTVITQHDSPEFATRIVKTLQNRTFDSLLADHIEEWKQVRSNMGSVIIPDSQYAKWFYRSIYTNYATAGSEKFLAAETQFAYPEVDWDMHAFTYGHGVWAALSFLQFGDSSRAKKSLKWLYQPNSLKQNVRTLIPMLGDTKFTYRGKPIENAIYLNEYPEDALAFGHEQTDFGADISYNGDAHWDLQFHLNGFASSIFHRYAKFYNDPKFESEVVYPVITGTASFWKALMKQSNESNCSYLPPMLSLSENIVKPSVLDAVLSAKWNLAIADEYETKYNSVSSKKYKAASEKLCLPQNDSIYLEYLNDTQQRDGGGYFGIRASAYLGFPLFEQIKNIDKSKARNTLDRTWKRNNYGKGMISFIANWFALTESYLGNGDLALDRSSKVLTYEDESDTQLFEAFAFAGDSVRARFNPYFLTGYSSLTLVPLSMMLQSYDSTIYFFPSIPSSWRNVEFHDLPTECGYRVSGIYRSKNDYEVWIKRNGAVKHLKNLKSVRITEL